MCELAAHIGYCVIVRPLLTLSAMATHRHGIAEVLSLIEQGKTSAEIAAELNLPRPVVDTLVDRNASVTIPKPRAEMVPWVVSPEHGNAEDAQMLQLEGRRRAGESLTQRELDDLTVWRRRLRDMDGVVDYSATHGFYWTLRTASDRDIVRYPLGA